MGMTAEYGQGLVELGVTVPAFPDLRLRDGSCAPLLGSWLGHAHLPEALREDRGLRGSDGVIGDRISGPRAATPSMQLLQFAGIAALARLTRARRWRRSTASLPVVPLVLVWFVLRDFVAVAPHFERGHRRHAVGVARLRRGRARARCATSPASCSPTRPPSAWPPTCARPCLAHVAKVPLGYFDANASGASAPHHRRLRTGRPRTSSPTSCPTSLASIRHPVAYLAWPCSCSTGCMGLRVPRAHRGVAVAAMWWMMGRERATRAAAILHANATRTALNRMNTAATEYVRGIPGGEGVPADGALVSGRSTTAIVDYRDMATNLRELLPPAPGGAAGGHQLHLRGARAGRHSAGARARATSPAFLIDFLFYVVFSALTTTMMTQGDVLAPRRS